MTDRRVFYVARFADAQTQDILNMMRFAAKPSANRTAHITVRGPCARRLPQKFVRRISSMVAGASVEVCGAGTFFRRGQNTVYLHCHSPAIKSVWNKPQHGYTPHLTIYDGKDRAVATEIHELLSRAKINFATPADGISEMLSPPPAGESELRAAINKDKLSRITGKQTTLDDMQNLPWQTRKKIIRTLAKKLLVSPVHR